MGARRTKNAQIFKRKTRQYLKRKEMEEAKRLYDKSVDCYKVFIVLAEKWKLRDVHVASEFFGITLKQAKAVLDGDLTQVHWSDYIRLTAKICFHGFLIGQAARS